jgi:hypothetical protein
MGTIQTLLETKHKAAEAAKKKKKVMWKKVL